MSNISILKDKCTGCLSCLDICPKNAIKKNIDNEGFFYPIIDNSKCVECGACFNRCHLNNAFVSPITKKYYGFSNSNTIDLYSCSSGGIATFVSKKFIERGGYVCGCVLENNKAVHFLTKDISVVERMKSSKYIQSDLGYCFRNIKKLIDNNEQVLFIGTPCQVAALRSYIKYDSACLFCVDLFCHGVPSQKLFDTFVELTEKKEKSKIININFRYKKNNKWGSVFSYTVQKDNRIKSLPFSLTSYGYCFMRKLSFRYSCYNCQYSNLDNRPGDISIGDFWAIKNYYPKKYNPSGVSSLIINTSKGIDFINEFLSDDFFEVSQESVLSHQSSFSSDGGKIPNERKSFYKNERKSLSRIRLHLFFNKLKYTFHSIKSKITGNH